MSNIVIEADIENGKVILREPEKLPANGKAFVMIIPTETKKPDMNVVRSVFGKLKTNIDAVEWQRRERAKWGERERKQWRNVR